MEDEAQKMVALKKAYAEIILNTAKEAAARIMVSERKALRFQQDLSASKEEALRMLLRLKHMIDSKTTEAELTSLSQQRRIAELEAQLEEAEEVITDLRSELKQIGDELEKVTNNQVQPLNGKISQEEELFSKKSAHFSSSGCETMETSDMNNMLTNQRLLNDKCCITVNQSERFSSSDLDNFDHSKSDIASIIMRSKKPELYRNGCTQRIRAFERNLLDGKLSHSGYADSGDSLIENEFVTKAAGKKVCKDISIKHDKIEMDKKLSQGEKKRPVKVRTSQRRKTRFGKAKKLLKSQPNSDSFRCKPNLLNRNDRSREGVSASVEGMTEALNGSKENLEHESCNRKDEIMILYKGQRMRTSKSGNHVEASSTCPSGQLAKPCKPSPLLSRCRTIAYLLNGGIESVEDESKTCENEAQMTPLPRLDPGLTLTESDVKSISGSTSVTLDVKTTNKTGKLQDGTEKDVELTAEQKLAKQESDVVEESRFPSSGLNIEMANVSSINCDQDTTKASERLNISPCHVDKNRLLKYTFQRKRKKDATSSPDEIASPEKSIVRRKTMEEYTAPETQKSRLMDESSRDSRRLAQVARQLISLSGKRWR